MTFLVPDSTRTLNMKEVNGVIHSLQRSYMLGGLPNTDYTVLIGAYIQAGLPTPGSFLVNPPLQPPGAPGLPGSPGADAGTAMLMLAEREFKLVDSDKKTVEVILTYQHFMEGYNQCLSPIPNTSPNGWNVPTSIACWGKSRASVQQTKTNSYLAPYLLQNGQPIQLWSPTTTYSPNSIVDYNGFFWRFAGLAGAAFAAANKGVPPPGVLANGQPAPIGTAWGVVDPRSASFNQTQLRKRQVAVGCQFPDNGSIPGAKDANYPGITKFQTGELTVMQPNENYKLQGNIFSYNPRVIKQKLTSAINSVPWMDGNAYEWMCTEVSYEPLYVNWQWKLSLEFQHNPDTWLPNPVFNDQRSGRPPINLLEGFGFRRIHYHPEIDFGAYFNHTFGSAPL